MQEWIETVRNLASRLHSVETREDGGPGESVVASLPTPSLAIRGRIKYVTNGRKVGEGPSAGTGVLAYNDGIAWRRASDDTTVVA